jgi:hypothetical protein
LNDKLAGPDHLESRGFDEKAYRRESLARWDDKWHALSAAARYSFLHHVQVAIKLSATVHPGYHASTTLFPPGVVQELVDGGFVAVQPVKSPGFHDYVVAADDVRDFVARARTLRRHHLLDNPEPQQLMEYVIDVYFLDQVSQILIGVLRQAAIEGRYRFDEIVNRYVTDHRWPGWVAASLNSPLADRILDVVWNNSGPISSAELPARLTGSDPDEIRIVVGKLVARLAIVEGIQPVTWELALGLLPAVRESLTIARMPRERPQLRKCDSPRELGPDGSLIVNDMRSALIEVASQPPRLRQNLTVFHHEVGRFQAALDPLAPWLMSAMKWSAEGRVNRAIRWAHALRLTAVEPVGNQLRLRLSPGCQNWLSGGACEDQVAMYDIMRSSPVHGELYSPHLGLFESSTVKMEDIQSSDIHFLGSQVTVLKASSGYRPPFYPAKMPEDLRALRLHLDLALSVLEPWVFYRLDSVLAHIVFAEHNPLYRGLAVEQVAVYWANRRVPANRLRLEEIGRLVISAFVLERLVPFGCARAAIDDEGQICIARQPPYDAFFGREVTRTDRAEDANVTARVVVQPDFSVVVIGLNPAPAAAMAPFCERTTRGGGPGAIVMKITRESVVKAVSNGLKPTEILARLKLHASNEVPANVLHQVFFRERKTIHITLFLKAAAWLKTAGSLVHQHNTDKNLFWVLSQIRLSTINRFVASLRIERRQSQGGFKNWGRRGILRVLEVTESVFTAKYDRFRRLLIAARREADLTQSELALKISRPQSFVSKYERGERRLDVVEFLEVARAIGVDAIPVIRQLDNV